MEISFGGEQEDSAVAAKRERLIARLDRRHANAVSETASPVKKASDELDELINKALAEIQEKSVSPKTIESLERLIPSTSGRGLKRIQDTLEELRKCALAGSTAKKTFSFVRKATAPAAKEDEKDTKASPEIPEPRLAPVFANNAVEIFDKSGASETISGTDGSSVSLKNLAGSTLRFAFSPSAVHMKDVTDCTIMFPAVDSSILMHDVKNSRVFAVAQQIRVHDSCDLELHVSVSGAVILETCRRIHMAPYRLKRKASGDEDVGGEQWKQPRDFDWLGTDKSPHWDLLPEEKWIHEDFLP